MELKQTIEKSVSKIALSRQGVASYVVPEIPRRLLTHAWRSFCPRENRRAIIALIDTSLFQNGREGFVFTENALYIHEPMHFVKVFPYKEINAVIYFQALSTYSGKSSVSIEIDSDDYDYEISSVMLKKIDTKRLNQLLQQIVSYYHPKERHEIEEEIHDSESQIAHPEKFKPHKFKDNDPQIYQK